ncbi:putative signal peptide protein [Puccinia sorghi]|uniref:Putative signal peptide protein n=1 Tax=Puccinia sorghi TaxID=27349 RepID=A0A0L6UNN0_9BASI|nr:putative signal peptide protein [Puccinia sorghi]
MFKCICFKGMPSFHFLSLLRLEAEPNSTHETVDLISGLFCISMSALETESLCCCTGPGGLRNQILTRKHWLKVQSPNSKWGWVAPPNLHPELDLSLQGGLMIGTSLIFELHNIKYLNSFLEKYKINEKSKMIFLRKSRKIGGKKDINYNQNVCLSKPYLCFHCIASGLEICYQPRNAGSLRPMKIGGLLFTLAKYWLIVNLSHKFTRYWHAHPVINITRSHFFHIYSLSHFILTMSQSPHNDLESTVSNWPQSPRFCQCMNHGRKASEWAEPSFSWSFDYSSLMQQVLEGFFPTVKLIVNREWFECLWSINQVQMDFLFGWVHFFEIILDPVDLLLVISPAKKKTNATQKPG